MHPLLNVPERLRVLVVEDDPVAAMLMIRLLQSQGLAADHATTGTAALEMHHRMPYRLVVSDWMMPEMDGVELCRAFRKLEGSYVYFVLCSAKGQKEDRLQAFEAGVDDFISKPVDRNELYSRMNVARRILAAEDVLQRQKLELEGTAQKLADINSSLILASRRFEELFNGLPVACFTFDESGQIHEWNREAQAVFGIQAHNAILKPLGDVLAMSDDSPWTEEMIDAIFTGPDQPQFDWSFITPQGERKYLACNVICLRSQNGHPVGAVCANLDITARKQAEQQISEQMLRINEYAAQVSAQKAALEEMNERLNHLAVTDGLTGLWNRRRFQEALLEVADAHSRASKPFSLILLDIDHFKRVNDDFGHQVGDDILRGFARILKQQSRSHEVPARYGGEEFAVILQQCGHEEALVAAERFREAVSDYEWPHRSITTSLGVATWDGDELRIDALIAQADQALYAAKQAGRNRVVHFRDSLATFAATQVA
jgi:two-component system cell cycle response regulator